MSISPTFSRIRIICSAKAQRLAPATRSNLAVPLLRENKVIGVFVLARPTPGPFTERQIELVKTFADQAVIAIENVRLFDEVQARTRDLSEALQLQTATADVLKVISRSAFDLDTVLQTLIDTAVRLTRGSRGTIFIKQGDVLVARAAARYKGADSVSGLGGNEDRVRTRRTLATVANPAHRVSRPT